MSGGKTRSILFLQGPPSAFWSELAQGFEAAGHRTVKVNVCVGDAIFWRRKGAYNFRGRFAKWRTYLTDLVRREGITDVVYYADRLPYHRVAKDVADELGLEAYALEFGYLRPDWVTLERGGMGIWSHFPDDPELIRKAAAGLPAPDPKPIYTYRFDQEAFGEVSFHLSSEILRVLYPFYHADKYYHPYYDYLTWIRRLLHVKRELAFAESVVHRLGESKAPYFLLTLQLQSDYQIRANSHYRHLGDMLEEVIESFAYRANKTDHLVVKVHPLDNGAEGWEGRVAALAQRYGVADRVVTINGGNLATLIERSRGVIVVNSTVGLHALRAGCPTKVLGIALFDIPGLTHQGPLDRFWVAPEPVDMELADALVRLMAAAIQIKGSFYNPAGRKVAIAEIVRRIAEGAVNEPGAYVEEPPRKAKARQRGIPVD